MAAARGVQQFINGMKHAKGFEHFMHTVKVLSADSGKIKCSMLVEEKHLNGGGTVHGGCTATLMDSISTFAFMTTTKDPKPGVSVDLNITYVRAAKPGETLIIESDVIKETGKIRFATINVTNQDGDVIALGRHTKAMQ